MIVDIDLNDIDKAIQTMTKLKELQQKEEKWQPKGGDYYIQMNGKVYSFAKPQQAEIDFGMAFETRQAAEKATKAYRKYHRLYKLAEELNPPDWDTDWSDADQEKFGLNYDHLQDQWRVLCFYQTSSPGSVYFASKERAEQAIKILEGDN